MEWASTTYDCDSAVVQGVYTASNEEGSVHMPTSAGYYKILVFSIVKWPIQIAFDMTGNKMYFRATLGVNFTNVPWKEV